MLLVICLAVSFATAADAPALPWRQMLERYGAKRDALAACLAEIHAALLSQAEADRRDMAARLSPQPPRPRPSGFGVVPELTTDGELQSVEPRRTTYALEPVGRRLDAALSESKELRTAAGNLDPGTLETLVEDYLRLKNGLPRLEGQLSYHRYWQGAAVAYETFFVEKNRLVETLDRWWSVREPGQGAPREILQDLAPFLPTPGLRIEQGPDGAQILRVVVATDINPGDFLDRFAAAVDKAFNHSEAARGLDFTLDVVFEQLEAATLYPEGPPATGAVLDEADHLARFPEGALVLTTGGASTHAMTGRFIVLGPEPRSPRSLAHEFAHLLGFSDAYLRGFEGDPGDPYGVTLVEWTGLQDDLMGSPSHGRVTDAMIIQLLGAYKKTAPG